MSRKNTYIEMKEYGLIGHPLGHSFSRNFFTEKFYRESIDAAYLNFDIPNVGMLADIIAGHPDLLGLNCTIPYKEAVISLLDEISPEAKCIGAVNVIKIHRDKDFVAGRFGNGIWTIGYNSDILGFCQSIAPMLQPNHKKALVLGTGGAAKAIYVGLQKLGVEPMYVSRKPAMGQLTYEDITIERMREFQVVVNCTPVGMFPHVDEAPELPYEALSSEHLLFDLVYNPNETLFLKRGLESGAKVQNGMRMLELQALAAWDLWDK